MASGELPPAWPASGRSAHDGEPGARPVSESLRRRAIHLTPPQSDALARLLASRRLVELLALRNGALAVTFRGAGYEAWRAFITTDGRVLESEGASVPDPTGEAEGQLTIVREPGRLRLGTLLPPAPRGLDATPFGRIEGEDAQDADVEGR